MKKICINLLLILAILPLITCEEFSDLLSKTKPNCGALITTDYNRNSLSGIFGPAHPKLRELDIQYNEGKVTGFSQLLYSVRMDSVCCENVEINVDYTIDIVKDGVFEAIAQSWHGLSINTWYPSATTDDFLKNIQHIPHFVFMKIIKDCLLDISHSRFF